MDRLALATLTIAALAGCRDAAQPFVADDRPALVETQPRRLTFSSLDDRAPTWNAASDSVYYSGFNEDLAPDAPATLLAIALEPGGLAMPVLRDAQVGTARERWFVAPVREPGGDRIAFVDIEPLNPSWMCPWRDSRCSRDGGRLVDSAGESPRLVAATLRVRRQVGAGALADDPNLAFDLNTVRDTIHPQSLEAYVAVYPPFQTEYIDARDFPFRPTWSPDGSLIAVSDGLRIHAWDPLTGVFQSIPGTDAGSAPAWSPDGARIAFTWLEPVGSFMDYCEFGTWNEQGLPPFDFTLHCVEYRTTYIAAPPRIVVISPDGSAREVVADGREPAWLPDGRLAYAGTEAVDPVVVVDLATGATVQLTGTEGARELAVSPDGRWLAFSRLLPDPRAPRDMFAVELP